MSGNHTATNEDRAIAGWGAPLPEYISLLAQACDKLGQRAVGAKLDKSAGYVSRVLRQAYNGDYTEAETLIRAKFGADRVACPLFGDIPLASCVQLRRRKAPPQNHMHHALARTCPDCPHNLDREDD